MSGQSMTLREPARLLM